MSEKGLERTILFAFCLSGASALIYEVAWMRALSFILGSTVYAISTMLATFMAGLAIGAYFGGKIADRGKNLMAYFGAFELGIGFFGLVTVPVIYSLPPLYFKIYRGFHLSPNLYFIFQFFICAAIMLVPTTLMGATFPVVSRRLTSGMEEMGRKVGNVYSLNTMGAVVGSIGAGFILIPLMGVKWASFTGGIINLVVGLTILFLSKTKAAKALAGLSSVLVILGGVTASYADISHPYATFYMSRIFKSFEGLKEAEAEVKILLKKDYAEGHIVAYTHPGIGNFIAIQHNGKMEGTTLSDIPNTIMLATLPAAALDREPEDMLVVGLGAGITTWTARRVARNVEVVEINPGVVEAVSRFALPDTLKGVKVHLTDARRHLLYTDKKYDIITSEPSVPSEALAANLFTKEFYDIAGQRLKGGGIFCQWLPAWILTQSDARACIKTFASSFDYVYLWRVMTSNDLIMIGSGQPLKLSPDEVVRRGMEFNKAVYDKMFQHKEMMGVADVGEFFATSLIRDAVSIKEIIAMQDIPLITDDRPLLEFAVAKNYIFGMEFKQFRK